MSHSKAFFQQAQQHIPGGVNSPVRAFKAVGGDPLFIKKAEGCYIFDEDNNRYIDYVGSWGPMIMGHNHPHILQAVIEKAANGLSFGAPTTIEIEMAEKLCELVPSMDMVRMVSSGTEATMSAIRLARGFTGRDKFIKFEGCYHGHADCLLVQAGSGALTFGEPNSPGVPADFAKHTLVASYNKLETVEQLFQKNPHSISSIIVEPVAGNMNCVPPQAGFLEGLRALCDKYGALLIFDEVMTGFRVALGGAQQHYQITADLTTRGKVIGGGMPVGAFGGRNDIMQHLAPLGSVYQAGTLSGNPVAMAAGLATLKLVSQTGFYEALHDKVKMLTDGLQQAANQYNIPFTTTRVGGMFGLFFNPNKQIKTFADVASGNIEQFNYFFKEMLAAGINLAPSAWEAGFVSAAHSKTDLQKTIDSAREIFAQMKK